MVEDSRVEAVRHLHTVVHRKVRAGRSEVRGLIAEVKGKGGDG